MTTPEHIAQLAALAEEADATSIAQDARRLLDRVREGRFFVASLGQFKRGKSTLINALLGDEVLPNTTASQTFPSDAFRASGGAWRTRWTLARSAGWRSTTRRSGSR